MIQSILIQFDSILIDSIAIQLQLNSINLQSIAIQLDCQNWFWIGLPILAIRKSVWINSIAIQSIFRLDWLKSIEINHFLRFRLKKLRFNQSFIDFHRRKSNWSPKSDTFLFYVEKDNRNQSKKGFSKPFLRIRIERQAFSKELSFGGRVWQGLSINHKPVARNWYAETLI